MYALTGRTGGAGLLETGAGDGQLRGRHTKDRKKGTGQCSLRACPRPHGKGDGMRYTRDSLPCPVCRMAGVGGRQGAREREKGKHLTENSYHSMQRQVFGTWAGPMRMHIRAETMG